LRRRVAKITDGTRFAIRRVMSASLIILGEVARPLELELSTLVALAERLPTQPVRLAAGRDVPGLRLDALLAHAGITQAARSLIAESEDGSTILNLPLGILKSCLVVYSVDKRLPLPRGLGGPLRLIAPRYGEVRALASLYLSDAPWVRDTDTERHVVSFVGRRSAAAL
jgi:hypothetical protein